MFSLGSPDPSGVDVTGRRDWGASCVRAGRGLKAEPAQANKSADGLKPELLFVEARRMKKAQVRGWWWWGGFGFIWDVGGGAWASIPVWSERSPWKLMEAGGRELEAAASQLTPAAVFRTSIRALFRPTTSL